MNYMNKNNSDLIHNEYKINLIDETQITDIPLNKKVTSKINVNPDKGNQLKHHYKLLTASVFNIANNIDSPIIEKKKSQIPETKKIVVDDIINSSSTNNTKKMKRIMKTNSIIINSNDIIDNSTNEITNVNTEQINLKISDSNAKTNRYKIPTVFESNNNNNHSKMGENQPGFNIKAPKFNIIPTNNMDTANTTYKTDNNDNVNIPNNNNNKNVTTNILAKGNNVNTLVKLMNAIRKSPKSDESKKTIIQKVANGKNAIIKILLDKQKFSNFKEKNINKAKLVNAVNKDLLFKLHLKRQADQFNLCNLGMKPNNLNLKKNPITNMYEYDNTKYNVENRYNKIHNDMNPIKTKVDASSLYKCSVKQKLMKNVYNVNAYNSLNKNQNNAQNYIPLQHYMYLQQDYNDHKLVTKAIPKEFIYGKHELNLNNIGKQQRLNNNHIKLNYNNKQYQTKPKNILNYKAGLNKIQPNNNAKAFLTNNNYQYINLDITKNNLMSAKMPEKLNIPVIFKRPLK